MEEDKSQRIEEELSARVSEARARYAEACRHFDYVLEEVRTGMALSDSNLALQQAGRERAAACQQYANALKAFSEFILRHSQPR